MLLQFYLTAFALSAAIKEVPCDAIQESLNLNFEELSSLVFVFDVTGSMSSELSQVKVEATKILNTIAGSKEKVIRNYIFVPFNDPEVGPCTSTTNITEFQASVQNLEVEGGGDCPEMSLTGIKKGLEFSSPNSYIFVFTDAHPKDRLLLMDVITLIREKHSQIFFILTGSCSDGNEQPIEYQQIAGVSTGQVFSLSKKENIHVLDFLVSFARHKVNLLVIDSPKGTGGSSKTFSVPIDGTLTGIIVSISGKYVDMDIADPFGNKIDQGSGAHELLKLDSVKIMDITNPLPGIWKIHVRSSSSYSLRTTGSSNLSFVCGFSMEFTAYLNGTNKQPFKGVKNYILVVPNDGFQIVNITSCELINLNGTVTTTIPLQPTTNSSRTYHGLFVPHDTDFYLQISGVSVNGSIFRRITSSAVHTDPSALIISIPGNQTLLVNQNYSLSCKVESGQPFDVQWLKNGVRVENTYIQHFDQTGEITLAFPKLSLNDGGNYSCSVDRKNTTKSKSTYLRVIEPASIQENFPPQIRLQWNEDYAIPCTVTGYPKPETHWVFNYVNEIETSDHLMVLPNNTFLLLNTPRNQSGIYSCTAENEGGVDIRHYEVTVVADDVKLDMNATVITGVLGEKVKFFCPYNGSDPVQWLKNGSLLDMTSRSDEPRFILSRNGRRLKIRESDTMDSAFYTCLPKNANQSSAHHFYLQIFIPLSFVNRVKRVIKVQERENVTLNCEADGFPAPTITWRKIGWAWPIINRWTLANVSLSKPSKQTLTIDSFRRDLHAGTYICTVKNEVSTIQREFTLF